MRNSFMMKMMWIFFLYVVVATASPCIAESDSELKSVDESEGYVSIQNGVWYLDWNGQREALVGIPLSGCAGESVTPGGEIRGGRVRVVFRTSVTGEDRIIEQVRLICK